MDDEKILKEIWKGNIPEFMAEAIVVITNKIIPFWLASPTAKKITKYMVIGGRAANVHTRNKKVILPTTDWDVTVLTTDEKVVDEFVKKCKEFLIEAIKLEINVDCIIRKVYSKKVNIPPIKDNNFLWRIGISDIFTRQEYPLIDIKKCPQLRNDPRLGDICDWTPVNLGGILYAPKDFVKIDIERMTKEREALNDEILTRLIENNEKFEQLKTDLNERIAKHSNCLDATERAFFRTLIDDLTNLTDKMTKDKIYATNFEFKYRRQLYRADHFRC
jgi:hypothetical protein